MDVSKKTNVSNVAGPSTTTFWVHLPEGWENVAQERHAMLVDSRVTGLNSKKVGGRW
jgi:hypothetical protein